MLNFIEKIKKHGVSGSIKIIKQKASVFLYNLKIKRGHYTFVKNIDYLNENINNIVEYVGSTKLNSKLNLSIKPNSGTLIYNKHYLLGCEYQFGDFINWQFYSNDIKKSYSNEFSNKLKVMDFKNFGDYRITWELNRHHHFVWYAQNYYITSEKIYIEKFSSEINEWIISNQPGYGINYVSSMEIAIRLSNWFVALVIFGQKVNTNDIINQKIIKSMLGQTLFLADNLFIKRKYRNNHSIVELAGLIIFQSIFNLKNVIDLKTMYSWLFEELNDQFYKDGINFEHSTTYSRFTIESILLVLIFTRNGELSEEQNILFSLVKKYVSALRKFVTPNGSVPLFSDSDNGRILFLSGINKDFTNFRGFFDFCGIFFDDDSLFISKSFEEFNEETKWWCFLSNKELRVPELIKKKIASTFFPNGGYFIYQSPKIFLAFKSNYPGNTNLNNEYAPHAHNDILSFEIFLHERPFLVDSGTYTYNQEDNNYREYFRSNYAHNTIIIDGKSQFDYYEFFGARNFPSVNIKRNDANDVKGSILNKDGSRINRRIKVEKDRINIFDQISEIQKESNIEINLNFSSDVIISNIDEENNLILCLIDNISYKIILDSSSYIQPNIISKNGWCSDFYNCKTKNEKVVLQFPNVKNNLSFNWSIILDNN